MPSLRLMFASAVPHEPCLGRSSSSTARSRPRHSSWLYTALTVVLACSDPASTNGTGVSPGTAGAGGRVGTTAGGSAGNGSGGAQSAGGSANSGGVLTASGGTSNSGGAAPGAGTTSTGGAGPSTGGKPPGNGGSAGQGVGGAVGGNGGASANSGGRASGGSAGATTNGGAPAGGATTGGGSNADVIAKFKNGVFWNDTQGNRIEAHGGGFYKEGDTWYWIGEDKSHNSGNFKGVNLYSSKNLQDWQFRKAILTRTTTPTLDTADRIIERPKLTYNEKTKQYVIWLHWEGKNYADAAAGVFKSANIEGPYTFVKSFRPKNNMSRDDNLFKDDDGKAYFVSAANENADLILYELTEDYLDIQRQIVTLWKGSYREAPAIFKDNGRYFLVTSGATGWDPNQAKYATATSMDGPWTSLTNLGDSTTFDTQSTYVIPVQGSAATTYIFAADRWQDPDLKGSKYIWMPLKVSGTSLSLAYYAEWQLNLTTGKWWVDDGYIPQGDWKLVRADSQETAGEDGKATNAFDDSPSTYWHTAWEEPGLKPPHELVIDLGATYDLKGFRYLPRQDKDDHGMIAEYDFYASESPTDFGPPVASGTFGTSRQETKVSFSAKRARYVRLVAKSEINGNDWASVAELDLTGTRVN
ncbi:MAG TPA: family 43 glycosylhydrolase [Polyangiaceae bacterium]|nr:family 43 glycosylhydrolase [Polyangiaceae bacterium]